MSKMHVSWMLLLVSVTGCRTLAPAPDDLDAHCVEVLKSAGPVPPECEETAERIREGRPSAAEVAKKEREWRAANPYAACVKDAAEQRRQCLRAVAVGGVGPGILEAYTGVKSKRDPVAMEAGCNTDYSVAVQICDAER